MAGLPGDLLSVVARYTVPDLTLTFLGSNRELASIGYAGNNLLWKEKVQIETCGLVLDETVVVANGSWRLYYFLVVRNHYGDLYEIPRDSMSAPPKLVAREVSSIGYRYRIICGNQIETHRRDGPPTIRIPRRVVQHTAGSFFIGGSQRVRYGISIMEDGRVHYTDTGRWPSFSAGPNGKFIVSAAREGQYLLDRDGAVYFGLASEMVRSNHRFTKCPNFPRVISIGDYTMIQISAVLSNGLIYVDTRTIPVTFPVVRFDGAARVTMGDGTEDRSRTPRGGDVPWVDWDGKIHHSGRIITTGKRVWQVSLSEGAPAPHSLLVLCT